MKLFASDITYAYTVPVESLKIPEKDESVSSRALSVADVIELAKNPQYDLSEKSALGAESESTFCYGTFKDGVLSAYTFMATGVVPPENNTAGVGFGGIGLRLPVNVVYVYKCFSLPAFRGQRQVAIAIAEGANALLDAGGWLITTADVNNQSSLRMFENLGFKRRNTLCEYRILSLAKYRIPTAVSLGDSQDDQHKRVEFFTP